MLKFRKVQTQEEIQVFANMKIQLSQYHAKYAYIQGIHDSVISEYDYERVCKNIFNRESFLLQLNDTTVGILQTEKQISEIDNTSILYIHALYFCEKYRDKGLGIHVLKYLCNTYKLRIECSCWYDIPAAQLYEKLGFKNMYTRYFLPMNNPFYDSDQN